MVFQQFMNYLHLNYTWSNRVARKVAFVYDMTGIEFNRVVKPYIANSGSKHFEQVVNQFQISRYYFRVVLIPDFPGLNYCTLKLYLSLHQISDAFYEKEYLFHNALRKLNL